MMDKRNTELLNYMKARDERAERLEKAREEQEDKRNAMMLDIFRQMLEKM
jgi:hypothetical protein